MGIRIGIRDSDETNFGAGGVRLTSSKIALYNPFLMLVF